MRRPPEVDGAEGLRAATPADAPVLARFAAQAFSDAFGPLYRPEDLAAFIAGERSAERFRAQLADPAVRAMLAEADGQLAAYALVVRGRGFAEQPEPRPARPLLLSQLYCAGWATGRGLGATLIDWVAGEARAWGADAITLSVYSGNHGAQRFYRRHGFAHVADTEFRVGAQRDHEYVFTRRLPGGGVHLSGEPA